MDSPGSLPMGQVSLRIITTHHTVIGFKSLRKQREAARHRDGWWRVGPFRSVGELGAATRNWKLSATAGARPSGHVLANPSKA